MGGSGVRSAACACVLSVLIGCGDAEKTSPLPVIPERGGPHMAHPQLVPIFFADDTDAATLTQFSQWIVGSSWLTAVGKDYGVGNGSVLGVVHRSEPAPDAFTDAQLVDLVYAGLADG